MDTLTALFQTKSDLAWFPPQWTHTFYLVKGFFGLVSLLLLVFHMSITWDHVVKKGTKGQVLRYLALLFYTGVVSGSTVEQLHENQPIHYRNLGVLVAILVTIVAMIISIREDKEREKKANAPRKPEPEHLQGRHLRLYVQAPHQDRHGPTGCVCGPDGVYRKGANQG